MQRTDLGDLTASGRATLDISLDLRISQTKTRKVKTRTCSCEMPRRVGWGKKPPWGKKPTGVSKMILA